MRFKAAQILRRGLRMGSIDAAACLPVSGDVEACAFAAPRADDAQERDDLTNCTNIPALLPTFDAGTTFPHVVFLPEPQKGSFRHRHQAQEPDFSFKWDIPADRDLLLKDEPELIGNGPTDIEPDAASSSANGLSPESYVRLMQLKQLHHPAWFRLRAAARPSFLWDEFVQRMTCLSDSSALLKFMNCSNSGGASGAGLCNSALVPQDNASSGDGRPRLQQHAAKRQCIEGAAGLRAFGLDGLTTACPSSSGSMDGVNWGEELMYLDQAEVGEERWMPGCALSDLEHLSHSQEQDEAHIVDASLSESFPHISGLCKLPALTEEQRAIVELANPNAQPPPCVRVIAAAGTGKTTTLVHIVQRLQAEAPDKRILYLVYNKSFEMEARAKLGSAVKCLTLDACAGRYGFQHTLMPWQRLQEKAFTTRAHDLLCLEIDKLPWIDDRKREADTPTADTQKGMMVKWVLKTLDLFMQRSLDFAQIFSTHVNGKVARSNNANRFFVHYPCLLECMDQIDPRTGFSRDMCDMKRVTHGVV